jgi:hypothetical protein
MDIKYKGDMLVIKSSLFLELPLFTATASLQFYLQSSAGNLSNTGDRFIRPQQESCYDMCEQECGIWVEGPEGPIPGSEYCRRSCPEGCRRRCNRQMD